MIPPQDPVALSLFLPVSHQHNNTTKDDGQEQEQQAYWKRHNHLSGCADPHLTSPASFPPPPPPPLNLPVPPSAHLLPTLFLPVSFLPPPPLNPIPPIPHCVDGTPTHPLYVTRPPREGIATTCRQDVVEAHQEYVLFLLWGPRRYRPPCPLSPPSPTRPGAWTATWAIAFRSIGQMDCPVMRGRPPGGED